MLRIISWTFLVLACLFFQTTYATVENYALDPNHTYVMWHINHFGFSNPSGKWMAEGSLLLDEEKPDNSKVTVKIKVGDIVTGIPKLDTHLKSKDFFDVAKYPTATFVSDNVQMTGKNTATVTGTLTLHGISKPVELQVTLNKIDMSPISKVKTAGFTATANIKRSDFDIKQYLPGLGDDVQLNIEAEADKIK